MNSIPRHVAIIPNGDRRWAVSHGLPPSAGHKKGGDNFEAFANKARELGIKCLTAWVFSTENWKRSKDQHEALFELARKYMNYYTEKCIREKINFVHLGRKDRLPQDIITSINNLEEKTKAYSDFTMAIAADYGGIDEIVRAVNKTTQQGSELTRENIEKNLDTANLPPLDLIIRTSGEYRLSGFMTWQNEYSEFYIFDKHFPDFTVDEFVKAVEDFSQRRRTFGGDPVTNK